ncbi:hypothetical protein EDB89DRAFT_2228366 [Lactarius sanguifluus]|nr:hypothetical protein EDB89DRAFT_2228366 [Lactarius sanguifluus]
MPVHRKTYDTPHVPVLPLEPERKFWPEHVPKYDIVPSPTPAPALAFKNFPSLSSPPLLNRRAACNIHGALPPGRWSGTRCSSHLAEQRRGDSDVDCGGSRSGVAEVEDSEEDDNGDMLDMIREELDQEEFNDDLDLDSDSDVDDEDSIYLLDENDDVLRAKDRKRRNRIFRAIHNGKFEAVLGDFIESSPKPRPPSTHSRSR